jgi:opacity protein-like surface antigen
MKPINAALLAVLLFVSTRANAQLRPGTQQLGLDLGVVDPLSSSQLGNGVSQRLGTAGPAFGFDYLYQALPNFSMGGDFNYKFEGTNSYSQPYGGASVTSSLWTALVVGRVDPLPQSRLRPYALAGVGFGGASRSLTFAGAPAYNATRTSVGPAFALGGGMDYDLNDVWLVGAELRYGIIDTSVNDVGVSSLSTLDFLLKVACKFGPR